MPRKRAPRARFEQDAPKRAAGAVRAIRQLRKLAGPGGKEDEWGRILDGLQLELDRLRDFVRERPPSEQIDLFGERAERRAADALAELRGRVHPPADAVHGEAASAT